MLGKMLENVRKKTPLIHNITNYVTVNDCANILLACGGSPIMADDINEVEQITSICSGLNINIGTLNQNTIASMLAAGKKSIQCGHPTLLDPVGAGASLLRTDTAKTLMQHIKFTAIRGNISEIKSLALGIGGANGVDACDSDAVDDGNVDKTIEFAKDFSKHTGAIIIITGAIDIVANAHNAYIIKNGHPMMSKVTGTGCMLSAVTTAYLCANPDNLLEAAAAAVCSMGLCGEKAFDRMGVRDGNLSYRNYIIDEIYNLDAEALEVGAKFKYC